MPRILLADDDAELCAMLAEYLSGEGYETATAGDGDTALARALEGGFDLIVLDVMMPRKSGFDVLKALRTRSLTPVLMLTARGEDVDSVLGLELGADDYLAKPCNPRVLSARIRAVLRRAAHPRSDETSITLHCGDLDMNRASRSVTVDHQRVELTSTEFSVLEVLMRNTGSVVSKSDLSEQALGRKLGRFDRSLDMHVSNLRRKLGPLADGRDRISTIRGIGYQLIAV